MNLIFILIISSLIILIPISTYAENPDDFNTVIPIIDDVFFTVTVDNMIIATNGTVIGKLQPLISEQIDTLEVSPSPNSSVVSGFSEFEMWLVLAAFSASIVGIIGMLLSDRRTREGNRLLKIDLDAKIRPIIARAVSPPGEKPYTIDDDHFSFRIVNNGSLPAIEIKKHYRLEIRKNNQVIKTHPESSTGSDYVDTYASPCSVGESYFTMIFCPSEFINEIRNTNNCYFKLKLIYKDPLDQTFIYSMDGHFEKGEMIYGHIEIT